MDRKSSVEGGTQKKHVEDDDLVAGQKPVERGKRRLKSEWKRVERGKRRLKSERGCSPPDLHDDSFWTTQPISPPPISLQLFANMVPLIITKKNSPCLIQLSQIALKKYNDDNNQDPPFEFDELVKSTRGLCAGWKYKITFKAKQSSNTSSTIFQACVWTKIDKSSQVISCAIKT